MPFCRTVSSLFSTHKKSQLCGPITLAYQHQVTSGNLRIDKEQLSLSAVLDKLYSSLMPSESGSSSISKRFTTIPDEHIEVAARYYSRSTTFTSYQQLKSVDQFVGFAIATAHSLLVNNNNGILSSITSSSSKQGVYVHGSVGVGKSMIMDTFYTICKDGLYIPEENIQYKPLSNIRCTRCHFHEFMLDIHQRIHAYKSKHPKSDPIPYVAAQICKEYKLLCFDEMQVTDIADAMIIKRLLTLLLDLGVVIVTTSNRPPCGLYEGGINRSLFMPFIDTLKQRMVVIEMGGMHDYRRDEMNKKMSDDATTLPTSVVSCSATNQSSSASYYDVLEQWFSTGEGETRSETIPVVMGRSIYVTKANDTCGWFNFNELCQQPLGAADYIAIAERFQTIIIENVPQLGGHVYNEARRFVILIDALYEAKTKLIIAAEVPLDELFIGFDATVETADGDEEIAIDDNVLSDRNSSKESVIIGEGGSSSSSSTTLIHMQNDAGQQQPVEWSATGRIGVSLAQLSAVREVSFSFKRAASRLAEMSVSHWGRRGR